MSVVIRQEVVRGCKVLHSLGLIDMLGNVSIRVPDKNAFAIKPGAGLGVPAPHHLQVDDVLIVDFEGRVIEGKYDPPRDIQMHCQIYRSRLDVGAIVHTHQELATAFATAHRPLKAIGHTEAELVLEGTPYWGTGELADTPAKGEALANILGNGATVLLPGHGVVCVGAGINHAIMRAHNLEVLSEFNMIANGLGGAIRSVTRAESDALKAQLKSHGSNLEDICRGFYDTLISESREQKSVDPWPEGVNLEDTLKARMELACRILYHFGLVHHLEHVTCRLSDDKFLISPRGHMGRIKAHDMAVLDMECNWIGGELAPPPFKWFHQSILRARPDVNAIVHTHQVYGRIYPVTEVLLKPVHRVGAWQAGIDIPVYRQADLLFEMTSIQDAIKLLDNQPFIQELHHGTDYVSSSLEEATVWAVHNELLARRQYLATIVGTPMELSQNALKTLTEDLPSAKAWWEYYVSLL